MVLISRYSFGAVVIFLLAYYLSDLKAHYFPEKSPIVTTKNGALQGIVQKSRGGKEYLAFKGIPYGQPPVGDLRFQAPLPAKAWQGLRSADTFGNDCYQFSALTTGRMFGSEDCLNLNLYTPRIKGKLPVMVWFYGGGFIEGTAKIYNPKYFMDHDIIIVAVNYRIGVLGFLNSGDDLITGNMGLKDQSMALKWVQDNIANFGGDASKVTIFGESAGGASVHYHMLSPLSKGLFSRAISLSGVVQCPWALTRDPNNQLKHYASNMKCPIGNTKEIVECLKKKDAYDLVYGNIAELLKSSLVLQDDLFVGSMEPPSVKNPFLSKYPHDVLKSGNFEKVPWMLGVTSGEGAVRTARLDANEDQANLDDQWEKYASNFVHYDPAKTSVSKKLREFYFKDNTYKGNGAEFMKNFTEMVGDGLFAHPVTEAAKFHAKHAPVYLYYYNYEAVTPSTYSVFRALTPGSWIVSELKFYYTIIVDTWKKYITPESEGAHNYGSCHADDLPQVWSIDPVLEMFTKNFDLEFSNKLVQTFVDFAYAKNDLSFDGVPWEVTKDGEPPKFMEFGETGKMIVDPFKGRLKLWDTLAYGESFKIRDPHEKKSW